jgi:type IV pilus assembly protein PilC
LTGAIEAENRPAAVRRLHQMGLYITDLRQGSHGKAVTPWGPPRVGVKELAVLSRQFATMVHAGLPLLRTLTILEEQARPGPFKRILGQVRADVERGASLSGALAEHPGAFSTLYVSMVRTGEAGGILAEALLRLAGFLEKELALRQKVKAAATYPTLLACAALGCLLFLTIVIVPQFATFFEELGSNAGLPVPTRIAIAVSGMIQSYWWAGAAATLALVLLIPRWLRTAAARAWYDRARLAIPGLGPLNKKIAVARFARTLGTLAGSGVPIIRALEVASAALDNVAIARAIDAVRSSLREGESISAQLAATGMFSSMVVHMVHAGEETGALDSMLAKVADFYDNEVETTIAGLTSVIEPALIVGMGVVIGSVLLALYLPIFSLATAVK